MNDTTNCSIKFYCIKAFFILKHIYASIKSVQKLSENDTVIIFASVPAGFGHLRVTDALIDGMPKTYGEPYLMGSHDTFFTALHRFTSIHTIPRKIFEWLQYGSTEIIATHLYVWYTRMRARSIFHQLQEILAHRSTQPKHLVIVAMHPTLAHQIGEVKGLCEQTFHTKITLVVQITDDSPMHIWYTPEADIIFAPSEHTKKTLIDSLSAKNKAIAQNKIIVNAYPVSPKLTNTSRHNYCDERLKQLDPESDERIHVIVPISGAAVGLRDIATMIHELHEKSDRFYFHIVAKLNRYTKSFIDEMLTLRHVRVHAELTNRDVVNKYEEIYERYVISLEITKPSEQAFKALLMPDQIGGSLLLFTQPVGRQERDNLLFLESHGLIPTPQVTKALWEQNNFNGLHSTTMRGVCLPNHPDKAARVIFTLLQTKMLFSMVTCSLPEHDGEKLREMSSHGVQHFWEVVSERVSLP